MKIDGKLKMLRSWEAPTVTQTTGANPADEENKNKQGWDQFTLPKQ